MTAAQQASLRFLRLMVFASVLLPLVLFVFAAWINYKSTIRAADERIDRFLTISHEHTSNLFRSANSLLHAADELIGVQPDAAIISREADFHSTLKRLAATNPHIRSIWVFDKQGVPLVSSRLFPVPRTFDNSDRDYFRAQVSSDAGFYVGAVVEPKVPGEVIFSVSIRRTASTFNGVIAIAIRPVDFQTYYEAIGSQVGSYFALLREDGTFLARHPAPVALNLRLSEESATRKAIARNPDRGILSLRSQTDAVPRRMGYNRMPEFRSYVLAGIDSAVIRNEWLGVLASYLMFGVPATSGLFFALLYGLKRTKRLYEEEAARTTAEDALRQAQKIEAMGQLTGGFAHDFNNLLMVVIGNLQAAQRAFEGAGIPERLSRGVEAATIAAQKAASLTQRLLAFARRQHLQPRSVNPCTVVENARPLLQKAVNDSRTLTIDCAHDAHNIFVDPAQLEVALLNLVVNARDATRNQDEIKITCRNCRFDGRKDLRSGDYVEIVVSDFGTGMSEEQRARAFEPFFTTKPAGAGTGLGLSQVFGFAKQSLGSAEIESELGKGARVSLFLPRSNAPEEPPLQKVATATPMGKREAILIVEDDDAVRDWVVSTLTDLQYKVSDCSNAADAIELAKKNNFAVILTDVQMPKMTGFELAKHLSTIAPESRVIFMTGYTGSAAIPNSLRNDTVILRKPVSRDQFAHAIRSALDAKPPIRQAAF